MTEHNKLSHLRDENARLARMVEVLMERAEQDQGTHQSDYALFETAAVLEDTVKARTAELVEANRRLTDEITRRRSAEEQLQRAKARAERASENKSSFLTAVSHDLQQPLTAAQLLLQAIADSADDDDVLDLAATGQAALETMESLLGSLIDIAKLDSGVIQPEPTHFRLDALLQRLGSEYRLHAESADLECRVHCPPAVVHSDPVLVERVVRNLLGNAVRYTHSGGLLLGARRHAGQWRVVVHDTGVGIPADEQQRIFRGFYRLPQSRILSSQGLGLGLTIVHMIAELLATQIRLHSAPGRGSTFSLMLPAGNAALAAGDAAAPAVTSAANDRLGQDVLVVENDPAVMMGLSSLLRQWGARVQAFEQPPRSLDATPEVALIDYHLGAGSDNGLAYAARLSGAHPEMTLIMITSERSEWLVAQCRRLGIGVLHKPVDTARLRKLISAGR